MNVVSYCQAFALVASCSGQSKALAESEIGFEWTKGNLNAYPSRCASAAFLTAMVFIDIIRSMESTNDHNRIGASDDHSRPTLDEVADFLSGRGSPEARLRVADALKSEGSELRRFLDAIGQSASSLGDSGGDDERPL